MAGLLTLEESAQRLRLPVDEVLRLVERRQLFPLRDGPTLKFKPDEIERYAGSMEDLDGLDLDGPVSSPGSSASASRAGGGPAAGGGAGALDISLIEPKQTAGLAGRGTERPVPGDLRDIDDLRDIGDSPESIFADSHSGSAAAAEPGARLELDEVEGTAIFTSGQGGMSSPGGLASSAGISSPAASSGVSGSGSPAAAGDDPGGELELDGSLMGESILPVSEEEDGLALESIGGASSLAAPPSAMPSDRGPPSAAARAGSRASPVEESSPPLVLGDDSGVSPVSASSPSGQMAVSGISDADGLSLAGESGISLDDDDLSSSGILLSGVNVEEDVLSGIDVGDGEAASSRIDLGKGGDGGDDDSVSLDAFDPVSVGSGEDETGSGIFAASSAEGSSFYGESLAPDASSFDGDVDRAEAAGYQVVYVPGVGSTFGALQVVGLVCCTLLLLAGGLVCLDLVGAIGSINGPRISAPLLDSLSQLFGWK